MWMHAYFYLAYVLSIMALDRYAKLWALANCALEKTFLSGTLTVSCELSFNRGVTGSLFSTQSPYGFALLTFVILVIIAFLVGHTLERVKARLSVLGESLIVAGALGNILDRFLYGGVVDFIKIGYCSQNLSCWYWPSFNIADFAIVIGVIIIYIREYKRG
jgi:signal peptidase II